MLLVRLSHLAWGAWIEIIVYVPNVSPSCRTSHGVRGLKLLSARILYYRGTSHLAWGAWIEITGKRFF